MLKRNTPGSRAVHVFGYTRRVSTRPIFDICYSKSWTVTIDSIVDLRADNAPSKNPIVNNLVSTRTYLLAIVRTSGPPRAPREITNLDPVTLVYHRNRLEIAL